MYVTRVPSWAQYFISLLKPKTKFISVSGAAAATNIAISGIKLTDTPYIAYNVTDGNYVKTAAGKATRACATLGDTKYDGVLAAHATGSQGNEWRVTFVGDHATAESVNVDLTNKILYVHFKPGTSTVGTVNTAIGTLSGDADVVDVQTAGTIATVLTSSTVFTTLLAGGIGVKDELPAVTSAGNIQFPNAVTTGKTVIVGYFVGP
jgi:hypothetical protein